MDQERRKYYRLPKASKVEYEVIKFPLTDGPKKDTQYKNIGGGGLLFETDTQLELGAILKLDITLAGWQKKSHQFFKPTFQNPLEPLTAIGKVVRLEKTSNQNYEIGVEFVDIYEDDYQALMRFIEEKNEIY